MWSGISYESNVQSSWWNNNRIIFLKLRVIVPSLVFFLITIFSRSQTSLHTSSSRWPWGCRDLPHAHVGLTFTCSLHKILQSAPDSTERRILTSLERSGRFRPGWSSSSDLLVTYEPVCSHGANRLRKPGQHSHWPLLTDFCNNTFTGDRTDFTASLLTARLLATLP